MPGCTVPPHLLAQTHDFAIKTWRYLRLAMVVLVLGLAVAVLYEHFTVSPACFKTSISAYYYTPVHAYFVGALIAIGVSLFCLRGNTDLEDALLNLAGLLAPLVALVPTPTAGTCASTPVAIAAHSGEIANNVTALLAVELVALVGLGLMRDSGASRAAVIGYWAAWVIWAVTAAVFWAARHFFERNAHYSAAVLMFSCILAVVVINAIEHPRSARSMSNPYTAVAVGMVVCAAGIAVAGLIGWDHWILAIETSLIGWFAAFWIVQTIELGRQGLRLTSLAAEG